LEPGYFHCGDLLQRTPEWGRLMIEMRQYLHDQWNKSPERQLSSDRGNYQFANIILTLAEYEPVDTLMAEEARGSMCLHEPLFCNGTEGVSCTDRCQIDHDKCGSKWSQTRQDCQHDANMQYLHETRDCRGESFCYNIAEMKRNNAYDLCGNNWNNEQFCSEMTKQCVRACH
jgi:hypothetical protein